MMRRIGTKVRVCERCLTYKRRIKGCEKDKNMKSKDDCKSTLAIRYLLLIEISAALQAFIMAKNIKVMFY